MNEQEIDERRIRVEQVVIDFEEKMFEEFELLRGTWGVSVVAMANLVRATDADLGDNYIDWLDG